MILLLSALLLAAQEPQQARIDSLVQSELVKTRAPGVQVAVRHRGRWLVDRGYGMDDVARKLPVTRRTVFPIGSITKEFTAAAVLSLVKEQRLSLENKVARYFPALGLDSTITVRMLLNHTSGIPTYERLIPNVGAFARSNVRPDTVLAFLKGVTLDFKPGARWSYSNTGYHLLGLIVERASGTRYFNSVGALARRAGVRADACGAMPHVVQAYDLEEVPEVVMQPKSNFSFAAGGLCATAHDLALWQEYLLSRGPPFTQMRTPTSLSGSPRVSYGLGLINDELSNRAWHGHGGSLPGIDAFVATYPHDSLTIAVIANGRPFDSESLQKRIARLILGLEQEKVKDLPVSAELRRAVIGTYGSQGGRLRVVEISGQLRLQGPGDFTLLHQGADTFVAREEPEVSIQFVRRAGAIVGLVYTAPGRRYEMERLDWVGAKRRYFQSAAVSV